MPKVPLKTGLANLLTLQAKLAHATQRKMGIIDELMDDAMESLDPEDMEEEVDAQVLCFKANKFHSTWRLKKSSTKSRRANSDLFLTLERQFLLPKSPSLLRLNPMMRMTCSRD